MGSASSLSRSGAGRVKRAASAAAGVEYRLPYGPSAQGAHLTFTSGWVTMNVNFTPTDGFELAVLSSHQLSPVLTLPRGARATWVGSMGGHLVVETRRPDDFENQLPVRFTLPCNQTSIASIAMAARRTRATFRMTTFQQCLRQHRRAEGTTRIGR